jgi:2-methylcitrate dehydratase PrpD
VAVVDIEQADGTVLTARCEHPRGSFENPLSRAQIEGKFRTYAEGVLSPAAIAATIEAVDKLEHLSSVRKLMDTLRAASQAERTPRAAARG